MSLPKWLIDNNQFPQQHILSCLIVGLWITDTSFSVQDWNYVYEMNLFKIIIEFQHDVKLGLIAILSLSLCGSIILEAKTIKNALDRKYQLTSTISNE